MTEQKRFSEKLPTLDRSYFSPKCFEILETKIGMSIDQQTRALLMEIISNRITQDNKNYKHEASAVSLWQDGNKGVIAYPFVSEKITRLIGHSAQEIQAQGLEHFLKDGGYIAIHAKRRALKSIRTPEEGVLQDFEAQRRAKRVNIEDPNFSVEYSIATQAGEIARLVEVALVQAVPQEEGENLMIAESVFYRDYNTENEDRRLAAKIQAAPIEIQKGFNMPSIL